MFFKAVHEAITFIYKALLGISERVVLMIAKSMPDKLARLWNVVLTPIFLFLVAAFVVYYSLTMSPFDGPRISDELYNSILIACTITSLIGVLMLRWLIEDEFYAAENYQKAATYFTYSFLTPVIPLMFGIFVSLINPNVLIATFFLSLAMVGIIMNAGSFYPALSKLKQLEPSLEVAHETSSDNKSARVKKAKKTQKTKKKR